MIYEHLCPFSMKPTKYKFIYASHRLHTMQNIEIDGFAVLVEDTISLFNATAEEKEPGNRSNNFVVENGRTGYMSCSNTFHSVLISIVISIYHVKT